MRESRMTWIITGKFSVYLDFIRWLAAVVVIISHIKGLFFTDYSDLERGGVLYAALYAVSSAGHQAVLIFFVLSGLFISANVMKSIEKETWSWTFYLTNRLTRLYIVLVPALVLGFAWDQAGIVLFGDTGVYSGLPEDKYILSYSSSEHSTFGAFAGNIAFLQGIAVGHFGSNGPLWSLAYEFWYYMLFPCLVLAVVSRTRIRKVGYSLGAAALCLLIGQTMLSYFAVWVLGFVILLLPSLPVKAAKASLFALLPATAAAIVLYRWLPAVGVGYFADLTVGCLFALTIYCARFALKDRGASARAAKWSASLAGFSYTAYLTHFPMLVFLHAASYSYHPEKWQPNAVSLGYGLLLLTATVGYCWLVSLATERHTKGVRDWIVAATRTKHVVEPAKSADGITQILK